MDRSIPGFDRLTTHPGKLGGKPCVRGMRISVRDVLRALASHPNREAVLRDYPDLEPEDLEQVLAFAAAMADWEDIAWPLAQAS